MSLRSDIVDEVIDVSVDHPDRCIMAGLTALT